MPFGASMRKGPTRSEWPLRAPTPGELWCWSLRPQRQSLSDKEDALVSLMQRPVRQIADALHAA